MKTRRQQSGSPIRVLPGAGERPTLKTIAFMTGLAVTTVSRALKDAPDISPDTKERVRLVAKQIGYEPNRAGVRLRTGKTNVISLIFSLDEDLVGVTGNIVQGISEILADTPYNLIITPYKFSEDSMAPVRYVLETGSADGIIISRTEPDDPRVRYLIEKGFPFAAHGRTNMGLQHPYHDFNNDLFAFNAVQKLAETGRKRIALFAPPPNLTYYLHMREGFLRGIAEFGLEEIPFNSVNLDSSMDEVRDAALHVMQSENRPDGFISSSGAGTMSIVAGIEAAGFKLGEDVGLVGKEMTQTLKWFRPEIMTADEDMRQAGRELAKAVLGHIEGKSMDSLQTLSVPNEIH